MPYPAATDLDPVVARTPEFGSEATRKASLPVNSHAAVTLFCCFGRRTVGRVLREFRDLVSACLERFTLPLTSAPTLPCWSLVALALALALALACSWRRREPLCQHERLFVSPRLGGEGVREREERGGGGRERGGEGERSIERTKESSSPKGDNHTDRSRLSPRLRARTRSNSLLSHLSRGRRRHWTVRARGGRH